MLIAQASRENEDREGRMFIGPSYKVLDELLTTVDVQRREIYMTNSRCGPYCGLIARGELLKGWDEEPKIAQKARTIKDGLDIMIEIKKESSR